MKVIILNRDFTNPPVVHATRIIEKPFEADGNFASQHSLPILRYPNQVILQPMLGVRSRGVSDHSQIMPDLPPLRQLRSGCHSSPGLKAWGFLARI
jgi:hypothetical protein